MSTMAFEITSLTIAYSTVYSGADQRKHQSSVSQAFVRGIQRRPVNSTHKGPVTRIMFPFDDAIMITTKVSKLCKCKFYLPLWHDRIEPDFAWGTTIETITSSKKL